MNSKAEQVVLENEDLKKALSAVEKHLEATISMFIYYNL